MKDTCYPSKSLRKLFLLSTEMYVDTDWCLIVCIYAILEFTWKSNSLNSLFYSCFLAHSVMPPGFSKINSNPASCHAYILLFHVKYRIKLTIIILICLADTINGKRRKLRDVYIKERDKDRLGWYSYYIIIVFHLPEC